jgi:hypothetical protein
VKLGVAVVYLFTEKTEPLLDVHLSRIERYTQVPYTIYAGVNRLAPEYRQRLERQPHVRICDIPDTELRGAQEHSYYLEHLVRAAIEDDATHVATLHLDSFPIKPGWAEDLAGRLSERCVFVTLDRVNTACLFFHRDFYCRYRPVFWMSTQERSNPLYRRLVSERRILEHSGVGYAFRAYEHGLSWCYLKKVTPGEMDEVGQVFDGTIFHLKGAIWIGEGYASQSRFHSAYGHLVTRIARIYRFALPIDVRHALRRRFGTFLGANVDRHRKTYRAVQMKQFLDDPEGNVESLTGQTNL